MVAVMTSAVDVKAAGGGRGVDVSRWMMRASLSVCLSHCVADFLAGVEFPQSIDAAAAAVHPACTGWRRKKWNVRTL